MSRSPAADASVSVTTAPEIETLVTLTALPATSTAKAPFAGTAPFFSASLKVSVSAVPLTDAPVSVGLTPSTLCPASAASPAWVVSTSTPPARIVPPLSSSVSATTATPSDTSPACTVYLNVARAPVVVR